MKRIAAFYALVLLCFPAAGIFAQQGADSSSTPKDVVYKWKDQRGVGLKFGINGIGLDAIKGITNHIDLRLGYSFLSIPYTTVQTLEGYNLQADATVTMGGANLLADYYPFKNIFHLTGGVLFNQTLVEVDVQSLSAFPFGDISIPTQDVGTITGSLGPGIRLSPYLALGIGRTLSKNHRVSFNFELGAMYQGKPKIELSGDGVIGPMASVNNTTLINDAIAPYPFFPMLNFLIAYKIK